jgi:DNA-binding transcriptional regulator YhcF (GntR family)
MEFELDRASTVSLADQIAATVRQAVRRGELAPGDRLPTIRDLAAEIGVNANTVAAAYRDLEHNGVVQTNRRAGTRVAEPAAEPPITEALAARIGSELGVRLADLGLSLDRALPTLAAAARRPAQEPLRAAVLADTPLAAEAAARRATAMLGIGWRVVPQTPASYRSSEYHLCVVDPALVPRWTATANRIGFHHESGYGPDFPAAAD